jgi:hypothetical protein
MTCRTRRLLSLLPFLLALFSFSATAVDWPQVISGDDGTLVIYQPQPEALEGNRLRARTAISIEPTGSEDAVFGAMWFEAEIDTDQDAGTALVRDIVVTRVTWPDSRDTGEQRLSRVVEEAFPQNGLEVGLDQLVASLESADIERRSLENLNNEPPQIVFADTLSVLLLFDGEPRFQEVEGTDYERALNTPFLVAKERRHDSYHLSSGAHWYRADSALGPWSVDSSPPADLKAQVDRALAESGEEVGSGGSAPAVVVATRPTELIATDGKPEWQSLSGGELLYVSNTETPWVRHLATGNMYVLLSGRWFRAAGAEGPWEFVRGDRLPDAFAEIPPASEIGGLRVSVAGTEEAEQAMLDAAVPQTAAIRRDEASLTVDYDGEPRFEPIAGTAVSYAVNTGAQVLEIDGRYYAVDDGVWFVARAATGPWEVADSIPANEINKIPADSPVYNVTHVHVYEATPEVVYVGYTPGYLWSYPYYGVPVYGTGWYYPPYWGRYYYPRPPTWGFHVGYNPWTGWNFGVSWSNGFFSAGISWGGGYGGPYRPWGCCGGWYGGGYRGPTIINTGDINIGNTINVGNRTQIGNRIGSDAGAVRDRVGDRNLYQRPENRERLANASQTRELKRARPANSGANNVYADRSGQVARRAGDGWETRQGGQWQRSTTQDRAAQRPSATRPSTSRPSAQRPQIDRSGLDRAHRARNTGMARQQMRRPSGGRARR